VKAKPGSRRGHSTRSGRWSRRSQRTPRLTSQLLSAKGSVRPKIGTAVVIFGLTEPLRARHGNGFVFGKYERLRLPRTHWSEEASRKPEAMILEEAEDNFTRHYRGERARLKARLDPAGYHVVGHAGFRDDVEDRESTGPGHPTHFPEVTGRRQKRHAGEDLVRLHHLCRRGHGRSKCFPVSRTQSHPVRLHDVVGPWSRCFINLVTRWLADLKCLIQVSSGTRPDLDDRFQALAKDAERGHLIQSGLWLLEYCSLRCRCSHRPRARPPWRSLTLPRVG
jgi:hypothetical protein